MDNIFLTLQKKRFTRSSFWQRSVGINIMLGLLLFFLLLEILGLGIYLPFLLEKINKNISPEILLNKGLIYYFLGIFMMRFFIQDLPTMEITPLLTLPVKKKKISLFLNYRSLTSVFNFLPFFLFLPFTIIYLSYHYSAWAATSWFIAIFLFELTSNFLVIRLKRKSTVKPSIIFVILGVIAGIYLLERFNIYSISNISGWYFGHIISNSIWLFIPVLTLGIFFWANYRFTLNNTYLDEIKVKKQRKENITSHLNILEKKGKIGAMILQEVKLLIRNKRSKQMILFSVPVFLLYGLFFYPDPKNMSHPWLLYFIGTFITGGFIIAYGQYILAWESKHFDFILVSNIQTEEFFRAKYYLMVIPTVILFILTIPYIYFGTNILWINFTFMMYNIGVNAPLLLFLASYNRKRMELDKGQMMNYQGVGINNFLNSIPILVTPVLLAGILSIFMSQEITLITISGIGLLGVIFSNVFIKKSVAFFRKNRYKIAEGYRNS